MTLVDLAPEFVAVDGDRGIGVKFGAAAGRLRAVPLGQRQRLRAAGQIVPKLLDDLKFFGGWEMAQGIHLRVHG